MPEDKPEFHIFKCDYCGREVRVDCDDLAWSMESIRDHGWVIANCEPPNCACPTCRPKRTQITIIFEEVQK